MSVDVGLHVLVKKRDCVKGLLNCPSFVPQPSCVDLLQTWNYTSIIALPPEGTLGPIGIVCTERL
eukprot:583401-Karenia_brevis.AAC.1